MKRNSRLFLALHSLGHMASEPDRIRTSGEIAEHAGTNPVVVRRVLGRLRQEGLVISEKGHSGGWRLARPPQDITLADVYLALDERLVQGDASQASYSCSVENALMDRITSVLEDVELSLVSRLKETTIANV